MGMFSIQKEIKLKNKIISKITAYNYEKKNQKVSVSKVAGKEDIVQNLIIF